LGHDQVGKLLIRGTLLASLHTMIIPYRRSSLQQPIQLQGA
jgi:hypothetical protein